jgi:DNA-binding GntR family transcriptional regulator
MAKHANSDPRYIQLASSLSEAITTGIYPVGSTLPTEKSLCDHYATSRHTVREALRRLSEQGMVKRRQGSGTLVISNRPKIKYNQFVGSIDDLLQYGAETRFEVLRSDRLQADEELATLLDCEIGQLCVKLHGVRYAREFSRPICTTAVLRPIQDEAARLESEYTRSFVFFLMNELDIADVGRVEQTINAVNIDETESRELGVLHQSAGLRTTRRYFDKDEHLLLVAISVHPGATFSYSSILQRDRSTL